MTRRRGLLFVLEWFIVADQATAFMSGCSGGFCFISSPPATNTLSWDLAQRWCTDNGTRLIEITNNDIQNAMSYFLNSIRSTYNYDGRNLFTYGKRNAGNAGSWTWVKRNTASYLLTDAPNDISYAYGFLQRTTSGFTITASRPTDTKPGYICENESQCTNTTGFMLDSRCYRSSNNEALSWYDARTRCLANEGDLASFDFTSYNQGLSVLNGSWLAPSTTYWVGLRRERWTWQGSQADIKYSNWLSGHPRTFSNDPNDCLCLEPSQWNWLECRCSETKPFICFSDIRSSTTTSTTTTTTTTTSTSTTTTTTTSTSTTTPNPATSPTTSSSLPNESITDVVATISSHTLSDNVMPTAQYGFSKPTTAAAVEGKKQKESLDRDIAIGIGVGVGGGVVVVVLVVVVAVIIIRKRSKRSNPQKKDKTKKPKKLQTPDIIALQTTDNQEETPYVTVIRLPDYDEKSASENAPSDNPQTIYANLEFLTKSSLVDTSSGVATDTGSSRPSSPSRLAEADVEVEHIDYNGDHYTITTCATFL